MADNATGVIKKPRLFFWDPVLHWPSALEAWGAAWPIHVYMSAFAFMALSVWAFIHFFRVCLTRFLPGKAYYLALNLVVFLGCPGRAVMFIVDPYGSAKVFKPWEMRCTSAALFPSITGAFILVFATLMRLTKMQLVSRNVFSAKVITFVVLLNYAVALSTDMLSVFYVDLNILLLVCECYFVMWGVVASSAYMYVFYRLYVGTVINRRKLNQIGKDKDTEATTDSQNRTGKDSGREKSQSQPKKENLETKLPVAAKITLVSAAAFMSVGLLHVWRLTTAVVYFLWGLGNANPWQWFMYKTLLKISELLLCGTVLYIGSLPFLSKKRK